MATEHNSPASAEAHSDIEIYIKARSLEQILEWLDDRFEHCSQPESRGHSHSLQVQFQGHTIPVNIVEHVFGKAWTSLWFDSADSPWNYDAECARDAHRQLGCQIRCNASLWIEGAGNMDEWLQINEQGQEQLIDWPS